MARAIGSERWAAGLVYDWVLDDCSVGLTANEIAFAARLDLGAKRESFSRAWSCGGVD